MTASDNSAGWPNPPSSPSERIAAVAALEPVIMLSVPHEPAAVVAEAATGAPVGAAAIADVEAPIIETITAATVKARKLDIKNS